MELIAMDQERSRKRRRQDSSDSGEGSEKGDGGAYVEVDLAVVEADSKILLKCSTHSGALLTGLDELYRDKRLCDVILRVDGVDFHAHRVVLAASSDMLRALLIGGWRETDEKVGCHSFAVFCHAPIKVVKVSKFNGSDNGSDHTRGISQVSPCPCLGLNPTLDANAPHPTTQVVRLEGVDAGSFETILNFIYTGHVRLAPHQICTAQGLILCLFYDPFVRMVTATSPPVFAALSSGPVGAPSHTNIHLRKKFPGKKISCRHLISTSLPNNRLWRIMLWSSSTSWSRASTSTCPRSATSAYNGCNSDSTYQTLCR